MTQETLAPQFQADFPAFAQRHDLRDWEGWFAVYEPSVYEFVLSRLHPDDVVLDIGAGDFRLALAAARRVRRVYAVEVYPALVAEFLGRIGSALPRNLQVVCANALDFPFPADVTTAVLLMRHCQHFAEFYRRAQAAGARRLLTNARWKHGVEEIDLLAARSVWEDTPPGWYACVCGATGFKPPRRPTEPWDDSVVHETATCPHCALQGDAS